MMLRTVVLCFAAITLCSCGVEEKYCVSDIITGGIVETSAVCNKSRPHKPFHNHNASSVIWSPTEYRQDNNLMEKWSAYFNNILTLMKNSSTVTLECKLEYDKFLQGIDHHEINALKMLDATAKWPSGILSGNINQYGDFDECMELVNSRYCLAEIDISPLWKEPYTKYKNLVHSNFMIRETFEDPKHRVPGFTMIRFGFCLPKSCSHKDLQNVLEEKNGVLSRIPPAMCQTSPKVEDEKSIGSYFALSFFSLILLCVAISTIFFEKLYKNGTKMAHILMSFSLQRNYKDLMTVNEESSKEIKAVHGVRALSALALLMAHKSMALLYNPYMNRTPMTEVLSMKWSVIGRNAIIYTDCFMLLSGLLNANSLFSDYDRNNQLQFVDKLINRIFRIFPSLLAVILFCTYLLPSLGSGPLWPLVVTHHSELCKTSMWRNLLFIHNYFGFENMCLTHTHQVAIDMQLFLVTPLFVYIIWKFKKHGLFAIGLLATLSTILRFWTTYTYNLSHFVHFGIPISRMFDTANLSYILPTHRATIYLMGVLLAYILRYTTRQPSFSKVQLFVIWGLMYVATFSTWFGPMHMAVKDYEYNKLQAAVFGAIYPISWGGGVAWVIYATNRGFGSWLGHILTWKYFQRFTKIAYAFYLVQFPVFFYNVGVTRHVGEYKTRFLLEIVETGCIVIISTILTLLVEMPFQNIRRVFVDSNKECKRDASYKTRPRKENGKLKQKTEDMERNSKLG